MTQPNPYQQPGPPDARVPAHQTEPIVLLSMLCCFPLGLVLLWTSPKFSQNAKIGLTAGLGVLVVAVGINSVVQHDARERAAAERPPVAEPTVQQLPAATTTTPAATRAVPTNTTPQPTAIVLPVKTLLAEYKNNEVRADGLYKDKVVQISGVVGDVKRDILGQIFVTVGTGAMIEIPVAQCLFEESSAKRAATLNKGDHVTVRGRVDGLLMNVLIRDATFVQLCSIHRGDFFGIQLRSWSPDLRPRLADGRYEDGTRPNHEQQRRAREALARAGVLRSRMRVDFDTGHSNVHPQRSPRALLAPRERARVWAANSSPRGG